MAKTVLDETLATSIQVSANTSNTMIVVGQREHDRFCVSNNDNSGCPTIISFEQLVHNALDAAATWVYEPAHNKITLSKLGNEAISTQLPNQLAESKELSLLKALEQFKSLAASENSKYCLIIDASLLFESITNPAGDEFQLLRILDEHARNAGRHSFILLRAAKASLLPQSLTTNPYIRSIYIGFASQDTRFAYASVRCTRLAEKINTTIPLLAGCIARATEDWSLAAIERLIVSVSSAQVTTLTEIEEIANIHRLGVSHSPWLSKQLRSRIKNSVEILSARVKGQHHAISSVVSVLKRAATNMSGAHEGSKSRLPRAALLLAGPTGTGKTEVAKSLAELIFGDQRNIIRFDCAEFRHDHAVSRLIGAPPGYVGFESGGELTESIREKPCSVVLFDEIEKAHPRIWDIFLSILSDGRLTNGSGQVSDFSQCIILFTSNLGMYSSQVDANGHERRTANFDMNTPYSTIDLKVRQAIKEEFVSRLGRPEILGRLGGERSDNIIVFDYLRDVEAVVRKFCTNICMVTKQMHNVELKISDRLNSAIIQATSEDQLLMGGRGVASNVEKLLTNPLAQYLFDLDDTPPGSVLACFSAGKTTFTPQ